MSFREPALEVVGERVVTSWPQVPGLLEVVAYVEQRAGIGLDADAERQVVLQRVEVAVPGWGVVPGIPVAVEQAGAGDQGAAALDELVPNERLLPFPIVGGRVGARRNVTHVNYAIIYLALSVV